MTKLLKSLIFFTVLMFVYGTGMAQDSVRMQLLQPPVWQTTTVGDTNIYFHFPCRIVEFKNDLTIYTAVIGLDTEPMVQRIRISIRDGKPDKQDERTRANFLADLSPLSLYLAKEQDRTQNGSLGSAVGNQDLTLQVQPQGAKKNTPEKKSSRIIPIPKTGGFDSGYLTLGDLLAVPDLFKEKCPDAARQLPPQVQDKFLGYYGIGSPKP